MIDHIGQFVNCLITGPYCPFRAICRLSLQTPKQPYGSSRPNKTTGDPDQPLVFAGVNDVQKGLDQLNSSPGAGRVKLTLSVQAGKSGFGVREGEQICSYVIDGENLTCHRMITLTSINDGRKSRLGTVTRTVREVLRYLEVSAVPKRRRRAVYAKRVEEERAGRGKDHGTVKIRKVLTGVCT